MSKLWQKGYKLNKQIEAYTVGDDYILDQHLVKYDCIASMAHARMLGKIGILKDVEVQRLVSELEHIIELDDKGQFTISQEQEDCHTAIENHLTDRLEDLGKKIHTARSRNDQVLTALRLFYKDQIVECIKLVNKLVGSISSFVGKYGDIVFPGYTHMRKAMPSSVALWGGAFIDSMKDNRKVLDLAFDLMDQSPLGSGTGYGIPLEIDREFIAKELGFSRVQENPIYVQNSRGKLEITLLHGVSQVMLDMNKIASDLILFSMPEFGFFELPKEFCTGSSIMPQKKNPDVLELLRARYHEVTSYESQVRCTVGNLVSGYNRDVQLTKKPMIMAFKITQDSLVILSLIFEHLRVNLENCERALTDEVFATERVYTLVKQGMPFREAYKRVAKEF